MNGVADDEGQPLLDASKVAVFFVDDNFAINIKRTKSLLRDIIAADLNYGSSKVGAGRVVNVEFVSANPTGPLHVGHGRQAALGDQRPVVDQEVRGGVGRSDLHLNDVPVPDLYGPSADEGSM